MASIAASKQAQGVPVSLLCQALALPRASYYRRNSTGSHKQPEHQVSPRNALSDEDRKTILGCVPKASTTVKYLPLSRLPKTS